MCGISGAVVPPGSPAGLRAVTRLVRLQLARGPDHQAVREERCGGLSVVLGHDRLSIVELSRAGNQPMDGAGGRLSVVFNGELYDFRELRRRLETGGARFSTGSDTEVLLASWAERGPGAPESWNGMFALGLLDRVERRLWLVRDRFGVKPLFWAEADGGLFFASSARALAAVVGAEPDPAWAARGLARGVYEDEAGGSAFSGIRSVPPGCRVAVDLSGDRPVVGAPERWYRLEERVAARREELAGLGSQERGARLRETLAGAVALRLRADVPVALSLSGGLDSASVAALSVEAGVRPVAFCFGDPREPAGEGGAASLLAGRLGLPVRWIRARRGEIEEAVEATLAMQDGPFPDLSVVAQNLVYRAASREGFKVVMGGQGADEALMGYRKYQAWAVAEDLGAGRLVGACLGLAGLARFLAGDLVRGTRPWRFMTRYLGRDPGPSSGRAQAAGTAGDFGTLVLPAPSQEAMGLAGRSLGERQILDVTRLSLPTLLRYEDGNSMGWSIESRLPFMDYRVMELGLALPREDKIRDGYGKWLLRSVMAGRVPDPIRWARYKFGFEARSREWVAAGVGRWLRARLEASGSGAARWLRPGARVADAFSDRQLAGTPGRLSELAGGGQEGRAAEAAASRTSARRRVFSARS